MGDVVTVKVRQGQPFEFVYKRKVFLKTLDGPSDDPMWERLVYLQAVDEVTSGNVPVEDEEAAATLAAQAMAVELQDAMGAEPEELLEQGLMEWVPAPLRRAQSKEAWAAAVAEKREAALEKDPEVVQAEYVSYVKDHPLYGTCFFNVRRFKFPKHMGGYPAELTIALNSEGLHFLNGARETLASYGYADIYRWGGSSTQFSIIIWNPDTQDTDDVAFYTAQAADMASLILDYINAIVRSRAAPPRCFCGLARGPCPSRPFCRAPPPPHTNPAHTLPSPRADGKQQRIEIETTPPTHIFGDPRIQRTKLLFYTNLGAPPHLFL